MTTKTFSKGDKVRVLDAAADYSKFLGGEVTQVMGVDYDGDIIVELPGNGEKQYIKAEHLIKTEPVRKFKVGDKVVVKDAPYHHHPDGSCGEVVGYHHHHTEYVNVSVGGETQFIKPEDLRLDESAVASPATKTAHRFSVGQIVVGLEEADEHYTWTGAGVHVKVVEANPDTPHQFIAEVKVNSAIRQFTVRTEYFGEVDKAKAAEVAKQFPESYAVGDKIKVTAAWKVAYADEYLTESETYEVQSLMGDGGIVVLDDEGERFVILPQEMGGIEKVQQESDTNQVDDDTTITPTADARETAIEYAKSLSADELEALLSEIFRKRTTQRAVKGLKDAVEAERGKPAPVRPRAMATRPKLGDKVRVVKSGSHSYPVGYEGVVTFDGGRDYGGQPYRLDDVTETPWLYPEEIVVIEEFSKPKSEPKSASNRPQIGDMVRVLSTDGGHGYPVGFVGRIVEDDKDDAPFMLEDEYGDRRGYVTAQQIELVEEHTKRPTKGDRVRIIDKKGSHGFNIGDIATIINDDHDSLPYLAKREGDGESYFVGEEDVELIDAKSSTGEFKVGDRVRMVSRTPKYGSAGVRVGDVGKIVAVHDDDHFFGKYEVSFDAHPNWSAAEVDLELA